MPHRINLGLRLLYRDEKSYDKKRKKTNKENNLCGLIYIMNERVIRFIMAIVRVAVDFK